MNYYKILYQELLKIRNQTEARISDISEEIKTNETERNKFDVEIEELKRKKSERNHIYSILVNYKDFIKNCRKTYFKGGLLLLLY